MSKGGLRKVKTNSFVMVPNETARDKRLSYRARGILVALLSHEDGWDVRSDSIAREGKEGREAVRTALHELGQCGYYRLERRRGLDGKNLMGTAISDYPIKSWIREYELFGGQAVPVIEQADGSYVVRYPDGTEAADEATPQTGDGFSGPGDAPQTGDGFPGSGSPGSGSPGPLKKNITEDHQETPTESHFLTGSAVEGGSPTVEPLVEAPTSPRATARIQPTTAEVDALFEQWWALYPRKVEKRAARAKFAKALKLATFEQLMAGVQRYATEVQGKEAAYIKHASGWLNAGRWEDETTDETQARVGTPREQARGGGFYAASAEDLAMTQDMFGTPAPAAPSDDPWAGYGEPVLAGSPQASKDSFSF